MKTLTVRLPDAPVSEIEDESRRRKLSKSEVVRERLSAPTRPNKRSSASLDAIADLIGSVDGLPRNLSAGKTKYLGLTGYGRNGSG
jgi:Arc/MetJ-type ribon-helix-helix transcriptional regulator